MAADNGDSPKKTAQLGDFVLKRKLGQGGMGTVFLGHQVSLDRECAVKVLSKEMAARPGFVERFMREARSMARIDHPNVVRCFAISEEKGLHFVAMELVDGKSMQDWQKELGRIPVPDALLVTILCGEALHHAHELNMVHRDVKPDNILVTSKGQVKVSDMGLAKAVDEEDYALTQTGTGMGTPHYMAPEQARNAKHVDRRSDVYALGCTLYHFVTGKTPFEGNSLVELLTNKEKGQFTPARRLNPEVSDRMSLMIDKSMAQDAKARYQTCAEFVKDLESLALASEALSFIDEGQRVVVRRGTGSPLAATMEMRGGMTTAAGRTGTWIPPGAQSGTESGKSPSVRSKATGSQKLSGEKAAGQWYVKYESEPGKVKVSKMSSGEILAGVRGDQLNEKTRVALQSKGPFLPLAQVPVFEKEARKMLARRNSQKRDTNLAEQYEKLAKQYERQKIWRFFGNLVNGTLGFVGLLIWLAIIAALGVALYFVIPWIYQMLANRVGLDS